MSCQILERQSTFWEIMDPNGRTRIHFQNKEEYFFSSSTAEEFSITTSHPLLLDYENQWSEIFISSPAADPGAVFARIGSSWQDILCGWRSPFSYMTETDPEQMVREGYGRLISGPLPLVDIASKILVEEGLRIQVMRGRGKRWPREAFVAGENFVVAESFRLERCAA